MRTKIACSYINIPIQTYKTVNFLFTIVSALCSSALSRPDCDKSILSLIYSVGPGYKSLSPGHTSHPASSEKSLIGNFAKGTLWPAFDPLLPSWQHLPGDEKQKVSVCLNRYFSRMTQIYQTWCEIQMCLLARLHACVCAPKCADWNGAIETEKGLPKGQVTVFLNCLHMFSESIKKINK